MRPTSKKRRYVSTAGSYPNWFLNLFCIVASTGFLNLKSGLILLLTVSENETDLYDNQDHQEENSQEFRFVNASVADQRKHQPSSSFWLI